MLENKDNETENETIPDDQEVAEAAAREIAKRDDEIKRLKKSLAMSSLYTRPEDKPEQKPMSKEDAIKMMNNPNCCNYDFAEAVCRIVDIEKAEGKPNPLYPKGDEVYSLLKKCLEDCNGDKAKFVPIYQSSVQNDPTEIAMAFKNRNGNKF